MISEEDYTRELLFDLIENEADVKIFIDRPKEGLRAEKAAIIIASGFWNYPGKEEARYTLYFGRGISFWTFRTFREAAIKALEMMTKGKHGIEYRIEGRKAKAFERLKKKIRGEAEK
jgi:hypothetical protein